MTVENLAELKQFVGKELPPSEWLTISQEMINSFAEATLDFQWIHTDVERAQKESPFGGPIAHGFMSVSLISKFIEGMMEVKSAKMGVNYGLNKVRLPHPVPAGSRLRMVGKIAEIEPYGENGAKVTWDCTLELEGIEKPACVGQFLALLFE
ncbi:MAG: MaoC family dehydratase [Bacteroidota bacterium]